MDQQLLWQKIGVILAGIAIIGAIIIGIIQIGINNRQIKITKLLYRKSDIENKLNGAIKDFRKEIEDNPEKYGDTSKGVTGPEVGKLISKYIDPVMEKKRKIESLLEKEINLK